MSVTGIANWAQIIQAGPVLAGVALLYHHHRCHNCWRIARYRHGEHHTPVCHRHRPLLSDR